MKAGDVVGNSLNFFVIHLGGKMLGVRSQDATLLACSFDTVSRRIARRGTLAARLQSRRTAASGGGIGVGVARRGT